MIWQELKRKIWYPIIVFAAFLLAMEVPLLNALERMERFPERYTYDVKFYFANNFLGGENVAVLILTAIAAAVCAFAGYAYLHSRTQLDLLHSMPVKREVLFLAKYISGFLSFLIPFLLHLILCILLAVSKGAFSSHGLVNALGFLGLQSLCFLLMYSFCIFVLCLTGNMIISVLGTGVLIGYSSILSVLRTELFDRFFDTFYKFDGEIWAFSPLGMMIKLVSYAMEYRQGNVGFSYRSMLLYSLVILLAVLVFTALGLVLYRIRATEAAGKPIAFRMAEPVIKTMVVLPVSLFCGLFLWDFSSSEAFGWFIFGNLFGFLVCSLMMEMIFRLDVRGAFRHWKQLIFNGVCLILIVVIFKYDVLGYNRFVPGEQELAGCAVSINGLLEVDSQNYEERYGYRYLSAQDYRFEHMNILENPSAMALAEKAAENGLNEMDYREYENFEALPQYQQDRITAELKHQHENYRLVTFQYTKKNGKNIYRRYMIDVSDEETLSLLADIFNDEAYKLGAFPLLNEGWKKEYAGVECESNDFNKLIALSPKRQNELFQAYQKDMKNLTLDDVMHVIPLGNMTLRFSSAARGGGYAGGEGGYKIYPQFTSTIALLKEYGFDFTKKLAPEQMKLVTVERYYGELAKEYYDNAAEEIATEVPAATAEVESNIVLEYTDEESKEAIHQAVINEDIMGGVYAWLKPDTMNDSIRIYYDDDGVEMSNSYRFYRLGDNKTPDFIEEDFQRAYDERVKQ